MEKEGIIAVLSLSKRRHPVTELDTCSEKVDQLKAGIQDLSGKRLDKDWQKLMAKLEVELLREANGVSAEHLFLKDIPSSTEFNWCQNPGVTIRCSSAIKVFWVVGDPARSKDSGFVQNPVHGGPDGDIGTTAIDLGRQHGLRVGNDGDTEYARVQQRPGAAHGLPGGPPQVCQLPLATRGDKQPVQDVDSENILSGAGRVRHLSVTDAAEVAHLPSERYGGARRPPVKLLRMRRGQGETPSAFVHRVDQAFRLVKAWMAAVEAAGVATTKLAVIVLLKEAVMSELPEKLRCQLKTLVQTSESSPPKSMRRRTIIRRPKKTCPRGPGWSKGAAGDRTGSTNSVLHRLLLIRQGRLRRWECGSTRHLARSCSQIYRRDSLCCLVGEL
ncbi:hypothetical protein AAG570_007534 [Ranatra chinensis]|uniref:Uncharacterized protein n=1 Tax=Ranatra chinensis TaxID=642074 RepID=A0ABD0YJW0_9HEMI